MAELGTGGRRQVTGFTLVELLVVIAVLSVLAALLLPVLGKVRQTARSVHCMNNLRQVYLWVIDYADTWGGVLPGSVPGLGENYWYSRDCPLYQRSSVSGTVLHCPQAAASLQPRWIYVARCDFDYSQNSFYQGGGDGRFRPITPKATHLTPKAWIFGDGKVGGYNGSLYIWPCVPAVFCPRTSPGYVPWMWPTTGWDGKITGFSRFLGHPGQSACFLFGDGHVAAVRWEEILRISLANKVELKEWSGCLAW